MNRFAALFIVLILVIPCFGWNASGHKAIALIAYGRLLPGTRARVDDLLSQHPDYPKWIDGVVAQDYGRAAFLAASVWPDAIRNDSRFHDDNRTPTEDVPGLPQGAQARHATWHYINLPFSPDGTPMRMEEEPNIVTKLRDFEALPTMPDSMKVYILPWLLHLVGDIHQPLHTLARFTRFHPDGDRGGNAVILRSGNLHSYWDSLIGTSQTDQFLKQVTAAIQAQHPRPNELAMNPDQWAKEGFDLNSFVYDFTGDGISQSPAILNDMVLVNARETAYSRAALAGYRLAEFLNQRLR